MKLDILFAILTSAALFLCTPSHAQTGRFEESPLGEVTSCIGGVWAAQEKQTDAKGRFFIPIRECKWMADGVALSHRQDFLYEDGTILTGREEGITAWDPALKTIRVFGVFSHGGVIFDGIFTPDTLHKNKREMKFKFISSGTGAISEWRSVETRIDDNTFTEEGLMLVDGKWKSMSFLTFHRLARIQGAGTYFDLTSRKNTTTQARVEKNED